MYTVQVDSTGEYGLINSSTYSWVYLCTQYTDEYGLIPINIADYIYVHCTLYIVQVYSTDEYGLTPLHMAVKFGVLDTVRILLQQGGDKSKYVLFQTFKNSTFIKKMLKLKK